MAHSSGTLAHFSGDELEVLGEQEGGLAAAKWSPDGELIVLLGVDMAADDSLQSAGFAH